jgi:hypothetical protein
LKVKELMGKSRFLLLIYRKWKMMGVCFCGSIIRNINNLTKSHNKILIECPQHKNTYNYQLYLLVIAFEMLKYKLYKTIFNMHLEDEELIEKRGPNGTI